jgi:hypothetical protein
VEIVRSWETWSDNWGGAETDSPPLPPAPALAASAKLLPAGAGGVPRLGVAPDRSAGDEWRETRHPCQKIRITGQSLYNMLDARVANRNWFTSLGHVAFVREPHVLR